MYYKCISAVYVNLSIVRYKKSFCYLNFFINLMIENFETMKNRRHYGNNNITE